MFFRALFALIEARSLYIYWIDVIIVFLYDFLNEAIYISQLDNFIKNSTLVCELRKTFYDFRQLLKV